MSMGPHCATPGYPRLLEGNERKAAEFQVWPSFLPEEPMPSDIMPLSATEKRLLASRLAHELKWELRVPGLHTRVDYLILAQRIVEILKSLPEDGDAA